MATCECCGEQHPSLLYWKMDREGRDTRRVCQECFSDLVNAGQAIRGASSPMAWSAVSGEAVAPVYLGIGDGTRLDIEVTDAEERRAAGCT